MEIKDTLATFYNLTKTLKNVTTYFNVPTANEVPHRIVFLRLKFQATEFLPRLHSIN